MRKIRRKRGSSLIMVVFITAIIFTTATSMIALVTTDYKHRINESKKLQNEYAADSGLDIVSNVITKNADAAIVYANAVVREYLSTTIDAAYLLDNTDEDVYIEANEQFKLAFFNFLGTEEYNIPGKPDLIKNDYVISDTNKKTTDMLIYGILNNQYVELVGGSSTLDTERRKLTSDLGEVYPYDWITIDRGISSNTQAADIEILSYEYEDNVSNHIVNNKITIKVRSTFNTINDVSGYANKKIIETKYTISAPDYSQGILSNATPVDTNTYPVQKAIVADGNLEVSGGGDTNVYGDVWIKGTDPTGTDYVYDKYNAGIFVNNSIFNVLETTLADGTSAGGNVYTANTFNLGNQGESSIAHKLYALNAYVGSVTRNGASTNNILSVEDLVTNNDLTLNSQNSRITTTNYYGINDLTTAGTQANAARESSSIIVNKSENSSINITNAYVMGVAYVDTGDTGDTGTTHFKTGESVGIKGNYLAYEDRLPDSSDSYEFRMYGPLYVVDRMNGTDMTTKQKADYFASYFNHYNNLIRDGGVRITNDIYSIGAYPNAVRNTTDTPVNEGATSGYNTTLDEWIDLTRDTIIPKKRDFAKEVFYMGAISHEVPNPSTGNVTNVLFTDDDYKNAYSGNSVENCVDNQIDWDNVDSYYPQANSADESDRIIREAKGKLIFNSDPIQTVTVNPNSINVLGRNINSDRIDDHDGDLDSNGIDDVWQKAVIITEGNVIIKPGVKFKGTIIAKGNVIIESNATDHNVIKYDEELVRNITAKYRSAINLDNVFVGAPLNVAGPVVVTAEKSLGASLTPNDANYRETIFEADTYLKRGLWQNKSR